MDDSVDENDVQFGRALRLFASDTSLSQLEEVSKALGSDKRLAILNYLGSHTASVIEIAEALNLPMSTATQHINVLEKAGLIRTELQPASRGLQRVCSRLYDRVTFTLPLERDREESCIEVAMPVGAYSDVSVVPTCGLASEIGIIGQLDESVAFYEPDHIYAQLLWFRRGFVEYMFPNRLPRTASLRSLDLSFEVCSEAPLFHLDWPSDITVWINGVEIGTWTSPGDFGGSRGALTPEWWDTENTQFGLLKVWKVTTVGSFVDGHKASEVRLQDLNLDRERVIRVRIGVKDNAHNQGGLNLFGKKFGNYPQDIVIRARFKREPDKRNGVDVRNGSNGG